MMKYFCVTFPTETAAMQFERAAMGRGLPGRLAATPRSLSVGCGQCWLAPAEAECAVLGLLAGLSVDFGMAGPVERRTPHGRRA